MINKRDFLKTGGAAIVTGAGSTAALASVRPHLDERAGLTSWQAHMGQTFEVDGHAVTLQAARRVAGHQVGEQFSLHFSGALPPALGNAIHTITREGGIAVALHLARPPQGLRADFSRLQG